MSVNGATNIYKIRHLERGEYLQPIDPQDYDFFVFEGRPIASSWKPVPMKRLKDFGDGLPVQPVDFPSCTGGNHLPMTDRAKKKIGYCLERYGEFLPFTCDEGKFWTFHVTHVVDALDENASDVLRSSEDPSRILVINRHVFRPERLTADWMFKLPQPRGGPAYVTDPFVNMIRASGLTGMEFKRIWPHS
jgi:hypothetical protein